MFDRARAVAYIRDRIGTALLYNVKILRRIA